jgi:hypothetical protein
VTSHVFSALDERCLIEIPVSIDALNDLVENVSVSLIESILMICGYWFLATQIDTFIRNGTALDPCAVNTYSLSYPTSLVLKILPKSSYKRITWNEIVILYGRFELLVIGGVYGELDDPVINAFNVEDLDSLLQKIRNADRNTSIVFDGKDALNYLEQLSNICALMK